MSDSVNSISSATDDVALGYTVINHALNVLAAGITICIAWSCSSVLMGLIMLIVMGLVMYLLTIAAMLLVTFKVSTASVASIGHTVGGLSARFTGLFSRNTPVVAA